MKFRILRDAEGRDLNLDDYSVDVDRLPRGFDAPEEFLDHFRRSFNSFINPDQAVLRGIDQDNTAAWRRPRRAPVGSVQVFDIYDAGPGAIHEQAGVVVSRSSPTSWTFSTISVGGFSPGDHPVSGHSEFGIRPNGRGGYEVYVRAVDRVTHRMDGPLPEFPEGCIESERGVLRGGDELWRDFQRRTADYINEHGGSASVNDPTVLDPPWNSDLVQHCVSN